MAIQKREVPETAWTHKVISREFTCFFRVKEGRVAQASPQIHWMINHRFDKVRETCSMRGYEIEDLKSAKRKLK
jgi:hypothetical protein